MADFERGQTFHDKTACNIDGSKGKYFIALSNASFDDDVIVCFVLNTERRMDKHKPDCNPQQEKFIIPPKTFSFVTDFTSIMLHREVLYTLEEMYDSKIKLLDKASDILSRQIKNCINQASITPKMYKLIKDSFP